jgi:hypothetical protein
MNFASIIINNRAMKRNFSTRINLNSFTQILFKRSFLSLVFLVLVILGRAQNISITPGSNPGSVVSMGDSLVFTVGVLSNTALSNAELEVEVPAGFELLVSTPDFKTGSLSNDKRKGRILIASLSQNSLLTLTVYVKALCDAETATPLADRKIKYGFYLTASEPAPFVEASINNGIQNFNPPILNVDYPPSAVVTLGVSYMRTCTIIQTRNYSHVNNMEIVASCELSGFNISKVEARRNGNKPWTEVTVETTPAGYRYVIKRDKVFTTENGYPNRQLGYNDTLLIRETVSLQQCDKGSLDYSISYGDTLTFCSPAASTGNVTYSQPVYSYNPDISQTAFYNPGGPASDGRFVSRIHNNSTQTEASMHDLYVNCTGLSNFILRRAYFSDALGTPILNGADTVFIPLFHINSSQDNIAFNDLNNSTLAAYYEARGLRDLDGDGRYDDLPKGNSFHFAVRYNYVMNTGNCPVSLITPVTRVFRLYYKTFCKGSYQNYVRNYVTNETSQSTNTWQGGFSFSSIRNVAVAPASLQNGEQARISGSLYYDGNGALSGPRGPNLFTLAVNGVSSYYSTIVLPKGLSFDNTQANPLRIGSTLTSITPDSYTVSPGLDTIRIQWTGSWGGSNYGFNIAVKNNGTVDNSKTINIYHEYRYGNTGVLQKFSCVSALVSYLQLFPCQYLGITSLNIERRSFGYTDVDKTTRVTDPAVARNSGFNMKIISPYDDMDVEGKFKAATTIPTTGSGNNIRIKFSYVYNNENALFDPVSGSSNGISLYYNDRTTPIQIPSSAMTKAWANGTQTQSITFDVAPYLNTAGINALNVDDSLKIVMHLRATTALPTTGVDVYAQMQPVTVISDVTHECSPLIDAVRIWNSDWANKTSCSGGIAPCIDNFYHYSTYNTSALNFTISWSTGQADVWGSEYRPNGDNFSDLIVRYPNLIRINSVTAMVSATIKGNMTNRILTPSRDYSVLHSGGATYLTIKKDVIKNWMSSTSMMGFGYSINFDMINPTAAYLRSDLSNIYAYSYSLSFDNYPTSAAPRRDSFTDAFGSFQANGGMFDYPYKYELTPIPANATPTGARAEWTVRITNQSAFIASNHELPHSWLAVECPPGVVPVELRDATNTPVAASFEQYASGAVDKYWIKTGTIAANPTADYILSCTYSICTGTPQLTLKYGMSKVDYPTNPDDGYSNYGSQGKLAGVVSTSISYTPPEIKFAGHLSHYSNAANNTNKFCDSVRFEGEYSNGLATNVRNLQLRVTMPPGTSYYPAYTPEVKFGNGSWANVESVDESISGELLITLDDSKELLAFGSPNNGDRAYVRYALKISCGVENGMQFPAEFIGHSGCGTAVSEHRVDVAPLKIFGLSPPPEYWSQNLSLTPADASAPYIYTGNTTPVNGGMKLSGRYLLTGSAENNVIAIIDLPPNLKMTGQDNNSDLSFTQDGSSLIADLPGDGNSGTPYDFWNIRLVPENPEQWTEDSVTIYIRTGKKFNMTCDSETCVMTDKETIDSVKFAFKKLDIRFSDSIAARSRLSSSNTEEHVEIKGWLVNDELTATFNSLFNAGELAMELWYSDGTSYTPTGATATGLTVNSINHRDSTQFTVEADIPYTENVCSLLLVLRSVGAGASNPYISDSVAIVVPSPRYEITSQPSPVCQMALNTSIGESAITGYSYQWTPATYLSAGGVGTPLNFNYDYRTSPLPDGGVLQYLVSVDRPQGCNSVDTVFVRLKGIPAVEPVADIVVCPGNGLAVNFEDNTGSGVPVTEFHWTVEAVTGDISGTGLPNAGTGNINVPSLVNATGASIVAKSIVKPEKDGCYGLADTFDIKILPASILNYPDIRLNVCPGTTVNLSKYIDTVEYPNIVWKNVSGLPVSAAGEVVIAESSQAGTATFTYEATNRCVVTPLVRKVYLRILSDDVRWQRNTVTICHEKAEALQINQIFGIEAGGTFDYVADDGSDISTYIKTSSTYGGAITMDGKAIYKETSVRQVTITYTPDNNSCLAGTIFTIKIILTDV